MDVARPGGLAVPKPQVPEDIVALLWWIDGPDKNYTPKPKWGTRLPLRRNKHDRGLLGPMERSSISVKLPVIRPKDMGVVERFSHYLSYGEMSPQQRWIDGNWSQTETPRRILATYSFSTTV